MDASDLDPRVYEQVLRDLARVNFWTFTAHSTLAFLSRALASRATGTAGATGIAGGTGAAGAFSLLDVGFGYGDLLRTVARWAQSRGIAAHLVGVDLNPASEELARAATPPGLTVDYRTGDYADQRDRFDFIVSSQVAHHMSDAQLVRFLRHMETVAERGWLVCDLHRHAFAYHVFPLLARVLNVHCIVREDGQLSIARSMRPHEWPAVLAGAGIAQDTVRIIRRAPFRIAMERLCGEKMNGR